MNTEDLVSFSRVIEGQEYRVTGIPTSQKDAKVTVRVQIRDNSWSFDQDITSKVIDLLMVYYLVTTKSPSGSTLMWCVGSGLGLGLESYRKLGFSDRASYDVACVQQSELVLTRIRPMLGKLTNGNQRFAQASRLATNVQEGQSTIICIPWQSEVAAPSIKSSLFAGVGEALRGVREAVRNPFNKE